MSSEGWGATASSSDGSTARSEAGQEFRRSLVDADMICPPTGRNVHGASPSPRPPMLNLRRSYDCLPPVHPRRSRDGALFYIRGQSMFALTGLPELTSFSRHYGGAWRPDRLAAARVFDAYCVNKLALRAEDGLLLESATRQVVMPEMMATGSRSYDRTAANEVAFCRIDEQWRRDFERTVPPESLAIALRFRRNPVALLRFLAVCPEAAELAGSNAAVFFELACHFDRPARDPSLRPEALRLIRRSQRELLAMRGLAASESARRFFAKMPAEDICSHRLHSLGRALGDRSISRWLPHLPANRHVAQFVSATEVWPYLTPQLLFDVLQRPRTRELDGREFDFGDFWLNWETKDTLLRLQWFHRQVRKGVAPRKFRTFGEVAQLPNPQSCRHRRSTDRSMTFPPPPVPGTPDVIPLTSPAELVLEGEIQGNCAGSPMHLEDCAAGETYFYRVLAPERSTARVEKRPDGRGWQITELRGDGNRIVGFGTLQAVCDSLGVPAMPSWCQGESWWSDEPDCVCSPHKMRGLGCAP